ncbi:hypothetical protein JW978_02175 [Candidatus Dojkabacteria bacterium]|nr:hypothetical protein [Candidatus Dojkabacteria bacterium]
MKYKIADKRIFQGFLFIIVSAVAASGLLQLVQAVPLADPADQFLVNSPKANSTLVETVNIQFKLYDDENANPEYEIALYQPNCITKYGTIAVNDYSIKDGNNVYTKAYNTDGAMIDRPAAADGTYCLKVCTTLRNGAANYSVCDLRSVTLAQKANSAPVITSNPPNANYIIGQRFGYDVQASDADGDALSYVLVNTPSFLQINPSTGEITSKGELATIGSFQVLVYVDDGNGGRDSQQFEIVVVEQPVVILPSVVISNPSADELIIDDTLNIEWSIAAITNISKIELFYSTDGAKWTLIKALDPTATNYAWDISGIPDGEYYLKIVVTDDAGNIYEYIVDTFSINRENDEPIENAAGIIDVIPKEDSESNSIAKIEATLVPSAGSEIIADSVKVLLDDSDISESCALQGDRLVCNIGDLGLGKHKIEISFEDSGGEKAQKSWFFTKIEADAQKDKGSGLNTSTLLVIFVICVVALFIIIIPWILYSIWRGRGSEEDIYVNDYGTTPGAGGAYDAATDVNVNIDPRTDLDSSYYTQPAMDETPADVDVDFDEYNVGEGAIGEDQNFAPVQPPVASAQASSPARDQQPPTAAADQGLDEGDIPDWLKGDDISDPVDTKGEEIDLDTAEEKKDELKGADPYSDYGLAQKDDN